MAMEQFEREVLERLKTIEIKLDGYNEIKKQVYKNKEGISTNTNEIEEINKKLEKQEEEGKWLKRTVVAAILTAIIGILASMLKIKIGV